MHDMEGISLVNHACVRIKAGDKVVFIDPFGLKKPEPADIILITHAHHDHFDPASLALIYKPGTVVCAPKGCEGILEVVGKDDFRLVGPGMEFSVGSVHIKTVPAYNTHPQRLRFHPRENMWVGYLVKANGQAIYHPGDSDFIPEMKSLRGTVDIGFFPIGGTYTMDAKEASEAALAIAPGIACPMHYAAAGNEAAQKNAMEEFKRLVESGSTVKVRML